MNSSQPAKKCTPQKAQRPLALERLEGRDLRAVLAFFGSGILSISGDANDDLIVISVVEGFVDVSGVSGIIGGPVTPDDVDSIFVNGNGGNDIIDLRGVSRAAGFTALQNIEVFPSPGNDLIFGASDIDGVVQLLQGGEGNDTIFGGDGADFIFGGGVDPGSDYLGDPLGNDYLDGGAGDDVIYGDDSTNEAGGGNDTIIGGLGNDSLYGGPGNDRYLFADNWGRDVITDVSGIDEINFSAVGIDIQFASNLGGSPADAPDSLDFDTDQIEIYVGGGGNDTFKFGPGANFGNGAAFLDGGGGTNFLDYSEFGGDATVNLDAGTATGVSSFANIQEVVGATVIGSSATMNTQATISDTSYALSTKATETDSAKEGEEPVATESDRSHDGHMTPGGGTPTEAEAKGPEQVDVAPIDDKEETSPELAVASETS